jgi:hypothetical protein
MPIHHPGDGAREEVSHGINLDSDIDNDVLVKGDTVAIVDYFHIDWPREESLRPDDPNQDSNQFVGQKANGKHQYEALEAEKHSRPRDGPAEMKASETNVPTAFRSKFSSQRGMNHQLYFWRKNGW